MSTKNEFLHDLISQATREGGIILQLDNQSKAVVLTIEAYNSLLAKSAVAHAQTSLKKQTVLVTGGAGYIGSHVVQNLRFHGHDVIVIDNLSTGNRAFVSEDVSFIEGDAGDVDLLKEVFKNFPIDAVMHFAASVDAYESTTASELYFRNNVLVTQNLLSAMSQSSVSKIIFSSTAAVYGNATLVPTPEGVPLAPLNPYGHSKMIAEQVVEFYGKFCGFSATTLRYFNACGADPSGLLGPNPNASALVPLIVQAAQKKREKVVINGNTHETFDGTPVRDFIHVLDIAEAHRLALEKVLPGYAVYNVGTGKGHSVEEMISSAAEVLGRMIQIEMGPKRVGDPSHSCADVRAIQRDYGFQAQYSDLETIFKTTADYMAHIQ